MNCPKCGGASRPYGSREGKPRWICNVCRFKTVGPVPVEPRGFFAQLTPEQQKAALAYRGPDHHGAPEKPRIRVPAGGSPIYLTVIGDYHADPKIRNDRARWIGAHVRTEKRRKVVQIGDFATLDSLNSHIPDASLDGKLKPAYMADIACLRDALDQFEAGLDGWECEKHITFGNHERRVWLAEQYAPHVAGMMVLELTDSFEKRGWTWSQYGEFHFIGGVGFIHVPLNRLGKTYGGKTAANQIANDATFDIVYGHEHTEQQRKAPKIGPQNYVRVINVGCALPHGHTEEYAKLNTTGWSWGVVDLVIQGGHVTDASFVSMLELERRYG